jgi:hypothetical protein
MVDLTDRQYVGGLLYGALDARTVISELLILIDKINN